MLKTGYCKNDITPSAPVKLAGFDARSALSLGVRDNGVYDNGVRDNGDNICVTALALECEDGRAAVCSFDLLGASATLCSLIREKLAEAVPPERLLICATHTHAAPSDAFGNASYVEFLAERCADAVKTAFSGCSETEAYTFSAMVEGVASRRDLPREQSRFTMPSRQLLLSRPDGDILACAFSCHSTVLSENNLYISRDLPGGCADMLDENTIFVNGACADLSTRYTRPASGNGIHELGMRWAESISAAEYTKKPVKITLSGANEEVFIPPADFFKGSDRERAVDHIKQKLADCPDEAQKREYSSCLLVLERASYGSQTGKSVRLSLLKLGAFALLGTPFELSYSQGERYRAIAEGLLRVPCVTLCYCGGYDDYLPSGKPLSFDSGYEDIASPYRSDASDIVAEAVEKLCKKLL